MIKIFKSLHVSFLIILYGSLDAAAQSPTLDYILDWDGVSSQLNIELSFISSTKDSTVFKFGEPGFGGQKDLFSLVGNLKAENGAKIKLVGPESKLIIYHSTPGIQKLRYTIDGRVNPYNERAITMELFRPVITNGSLYLISSFFMMTPENHPAKSVSIRFSRLPKGTPSFYSWAPGADPEKRQYMPIEKSDEIMIVMGSKLKISKYSIHKIPYYFIHTTGDTSNIIDTEIAPFFSNYFPSLRDFWKDYDADRYYIYIAQLLSARKPFGGGFGLVSGFVMKYHGKFDTWKKEVIAHETSHTWIGQKMMVGKDNFENQWFGEGFNDYVCLINLYHSGIFSQDTLINYFNNIVIRPHYESAVNQMPNNSIASKYWTDKAFEKLPYRRGAIYAFYLDNQIRLASKGKYSLRNMLLDLYDKNKKIKKNNPNLSLSLNDFVDILGRFLPKEPAKIAMEKYMIRGELIDLHSVELCPNFKITSDGIIPVLSLNKEYDLKTFYHW